MPIAICLGWLLLATASAQEPSLAGTAAPAVVSVASVDVLHASARSTSTADPNEPAKPKEQKFAVPEAPTLLIVGTCLVLVALAKRRVPVPPTVRR